MTTETDCPSHIEARERLEAAAQRLPRVWPTGEAVNRGVIVDPADLRTLLATPTQGHISSSRDHALSAGSALDGLPGAENPDLLTIPECIDRLRRRAADAMWALDPMTVSARVLRELLAGYTPTGNCPKCGGGHGTRGEDCNGPARAKAPPFKMMG